MIRPPKTLQPARACPLVLLAPDAPTRPWEVLADREGAVLSTIDAPLAVESLRRTRDAACRRFAVDPDRIFLVGTEAPELAAEVSAAVAAPGPEGWRELSARKKPAPNLSPRTRLQVTVSNARSTRGKLLVALYRSEKSFGKPSEATVATGVWTPEGPVSATFSDLAAGEYAVLLFHDENGNGKLDTKLFGIPKEGYGASNDPGARMGPPRWPECRFAITGAGAERELSIRLKYP